MPVNVLVADSSKNLDYIADTIEIDSGITVAFRVKNAMDTLSYALRRPIDVIVISTNVTDMELGKLIYRVMKRKPTPFLILRDPTDRTRYGGKFEIGHIDYLSVSYSGQKVDIKEVALTTRIHILSKINMKKIETKLSSLMRDEKESNPIEDRLTSYKKTSSIKKPIYQSDSLYRDDIEGLRIVSRKKIICIGSSTGGPKVLNNIIPALPSRFPPVLVVQHIPEGFIESFATRLNRISNITVKKAENGEMIKANTVYMAPGGFHLELSKHDSIPKIALTTTPPVNYVRPSVDVTLLSLLDHYKSGIISVILLGMGSDGKDGSARIKKKGGKVIALNKDDAEKYGIYGMNKSVIDAGITDAILPASKIVKGIIDALLDRI